MGLCRKESAMRRRDFFGAAASASVIGAGSAFAGPVAQPAKYKAGAYSAIPDKIGGLLLEDLREDYRRRLFDEYLPFWEKGGYDKVNGGFMCELRDDGSVVNDQKDIWYQGRGIWVYSAIYNYLDKNPKWLEIAKKSRDFMVKNMHNGDGTWKKTVTREGKDAAETVGQGSMKDIYGAMFAAAGLVQYYRAAGKEEDLALAIQSIKKSVERYENPNYEGGGIINGKKGIRKQGHTFMMVWTLPQLLEVEHDSMLDELAREHLDCVLNRYWNNDYGISNETMYHDYTPIPELAASTAPGHSIETHWMAMTEALREKNGTTFSILKNRIRRLTEMSWDYIFEGSGDGAYHVFATEDRGAGPVLDLKTMWAHCEILLGTMMSLEYTGDVWAKEWYERCRDFSHRAFVTDHGVWRQAVDRYGKDKKRGGITIYRKGNFHQPRYFIYNLMALDRMIKNKGKLTPFPL